MTFSLPLVELGGSTGKASMTPEPKFDLRSNYILKSIQICLNIVKNVKYSKPRRNVRTRFGVKPSRGNSER